MTVGKRSALAVWLLVGAALAQEVPVYSPVPQLQKALRSANVDVRRAAAEQLGAVSEGVIGLPGAVAVPDLLRAFAEDADEGVSVHAALSLARIGTSPLGAFDHVAANLDRWRELGAGADVLDRVRAVLAAADEQWPGAALVPPIVQLLQAPRCVPHALGVLAVLGEDAVAAAPEVDALLAGDDEAVRWRAAFALFRLGAGETPALRRARDNGHGAVRLWATRVRFAVASTDARDAKRLVPWVDDERRAVREWALRTAGGLGAAAEPVVQAIAVRWADVTFRIEAWPTLLVLGEHAAAAVPGLVSMLPPRDEPERIDRYEPVRAIELLGRIGPRAGDATDALLALATAPMPADQHDFVAQAAVAALAAIAPDRALAALLPGVEAKAADFPADYRVWRFQVLRGVAAPAVPRLRTMLAADRGAKARALLALEAIGERALPALPDVLPLLEVDDEYVRRMAMQVLEAIGLPAGPAVIPVIERLRERATGNWGTDLMREASRFGAAAEPLLVQATTDPERWTRAIAVEQLCKLPARTPAGTAAVLARLADADAIVRDKVMDVLGEPEWRAAMLERVPALLAASDDPHVRRRCVDLLLATHVHVPERADDRIDRDGAQQLLGAWNVASRSAEECTLFRSAERVEGWVRSFAVAADATHRAAAAATLGCLASTPSSRRALADLATDRDAFVRQAAIRALGRHGRAARDELPVLARALRDPDWFVRAAAAPALRAVHRAH